MSDPDPYAPPTAHLEEVRAPSQEQLATRSQRIGNYFLDYFGMLLFSLALGVVIAILDPALFDQVNDIVFGLVTALFYYVSTEAAFGRSPAKFITGTRVVSAQGGPASFGQILGRTAVRLVPFEAFSFAREQHPGWHDAWSGTRVIRTRPTRNESR